MSPDADGLMRAPIKTVVILGFILLILQAISEAIKSGAIIQDHPLPPGMASSADQAPPTELPNAGPSQEDG